MVPSPLILARSVWKVLSRAIEKLTAFTHFGTAPAAVLNFIGTYFYSTVGFQIN
jgi:hypothetical protein